MPLCRVALPPAKRPLLSLVAIECHPNHGRCIRLLSQHMHALNAGGADGDWLGPGGPAKKGGWWRSLFGQRRELAKEDHLSSRSAAASPAPRGSAAEARDRLARCFCYTHVPVQCVTLLEVLDSNMWLCLPAVWFSAGCLVECA